VTAFNVMRGCTLDFSIYVTGADALDDSCRVAERFRCPAQAPPPAEAPDHASRCR
jgi:predicted transcriptional regulator